MAKFSGESGPLQFTHFSGSFLYFCKCLDKEGNSCFDMEIQLVAYMLNEVN